jgi:hypothetical protein
MYCRSVSGDVVLRDKHGGTFPAGVKLSRRAAAAQCDDEVLIYVFTDTSEARRAQHALQLDEVC